MRLFWNRLANRKLVLYMKKNANRFCIVFDPYDEQELIAMNILNSLPSRKKAKYIAKAICKYDKKTNSVSINTTEKRGRGRPPKIKQPVAQLNQTEAKTPVRENAASSLSHIQMNSHTVPDTKKVSSAMVDSMMEFVHNS